MQYLVTISITIITGTLIFVLQEVIKSYVIKPKTEYEELKSKISFLLIYYAGVIHNPRSNDSNGDESCLEMYKNAEMQFRDVASRLMSFSRKSHKLVKCIPPNDILYRASKNLIGLANGVYKENTKDNVRKHNIEHEKELKKLLNI